MKPFRSSFTARLLTAAASFALIGGGLIPILGLERAVAIPFVLLLAVGAGIVGLVLGVNDHPGEVAVLAILLPMAFWAYVCALLLVVEKLPTYGWVLVSVGAAPLLLLIGSLGFKSERSTARIPRAA